jgi:hypothetical protein
MCGNEQGGGTDKPSDEPMFPKMVGKLGQFLSVFPYNVRFGKGGPL